MSYRRDIHTQISRGIDFHHRHMLTAPSLFVVYPPPHFCKHDPPCRAGTTDPHAFDTIQRDLHRVSNVINTPGASRKRFRRTYGSHGVNSYESKQDNKTYNVLVFPFFFKISIPLENTSTKAAKSLATNTLGKKKVAQSLTTNTLGKKKVAQFLATSTLGIFGG